MTGFNSKRQAAKTKMDDDDAQNYVAEYEAALLISYQSGFADGKRAAQRPWVDLTDGDWEWVADKKETSLDTFAHGAAWAADQLKEKNT